MRSARAVVCPDRGVPTRQGCLRRSDPERGHYRYELRGTESMHRKLVLVLTMFAVAFGSLSQAQAALASPRVPGSIATHSATGAVRAAAATRHIAHGARLRAQEQTRIPAPGQGPPSDGNALGDGRPGVPDHQHRRRHLRRRPARDLYRHDDRGIPRASCPRRSHCRRESRSPTTRTARRHLREHRLRTPAERTRSRSTPRTVSFLTPPRASPSRSTRRPRSPALPASPLPPARPGPLPSRRPGIPRPHCPTTGAPAAGSHVHRQRGRHGDTRGNTGCEHRRCVPCSRSSPRTVSVLTPPRPSPSRSTRRPGSPAPTTPPVLSARPAPLPSRRPGRLSLTCPRWAHCPRGVRFKDNGDGTAALSGTPAAGYRRYVPVHDHRHERRQS